MGKWARNGIEPRVLVSAAGFAVATALVSWILVGWNGLFGSYTGTLMELVNEVVGAGHHARAAVLIGLGLFAVVPAVLGAVLRSWQWVFCAPLALVFAESLTWIPHALAGERPIPFAALVWVALLFGLPAALAAVIGTKMGMYRWQVGTS